MRRKRFRHTEKSLFGEAYAHGLFDAPGSLLFRGTSVDSDGSWEDCEDIFRQIGCRTRCNVDVSAAA